MSDSIHLDQGRKGFIARHAAFDDLIGDAATLRMLLKEPSGQPLFHEAGVFLAKSQSVYVSSNRLPCARGRQRATITRIPVDAIPAPSLSIDCRASIIESLEDSDEGAKLWTQLETMSEEDFPGELSMPNGATQWHGRQGQDAVLWCAQGHHDLDGDGSVEVDSALVSMAVDEQGRLAGTEVVLDAFQGRKFSSLNDVVVHEQSGCVFFTDPDYGVGQSFKRKVMDYAPNALYAWLPSSGQVKVIDADFHQPNGVTFIPDPREPHSGRGLLVATDTGRFVFDPDKRMGTLRIDHQRAASIYTYRVEPASDPDVDPFPSVDAARELLWDSECGVPDGVHPDEKGNLWVGHGDGVHVYNPWSRQLIGKILIPGGKGVANFCWGGRAGSHPRSDQPMYRVLMFAEDELWEACIAVNGRD